MGCYDCGERDWLVSAPKALNGGSGPRSSPNIIDSSFNKSSGHDVSLIPPAAYGWRHVSNC